MLYPRSLLWWGGWLVLDFVKLNDCTVGLLHKPRHACMMSASESVGEKCVLSEVFGHRGCSSCMVNHSMVIMVNPTIM